MMPMEIVCVTRILLWVLQYVGRLSVILVMKLKLNLLTRLFTYRKLTKTNYINSCKVLSASYIAKVSRNINLGTLVTVCAFRELFGHFLKVLATNLLTELAQIFGDFGLFCTTSPS